MMMDNGGEYTRQQRQQLLSLPSSLRCVIYKNTPHTHTRIYKIDTRNLKFGLINIMFNSNPIVLALVAMAVFVIMEAAELPNKKDNAVVTLVMGEKSGYSAGAIALGQSLKDVGSKLSKICLVTPDVEEFNRQSLSKLWKVVEVEPIYCNHKLDPSVNEQEYDLKGEQYIAGITRWSTTCTKFAAWKLTQFKRIVFFDSDVVVLQPIDDVLYGFSNASFAAAPETFPPDTFNSGAMVLNPSLETFARLLRLNEEVGSAEGGDQGVFNNGLCPNWYTVGPGVYILASCAIFVDLSHVILMTINCGCYRRSSLRKDSVDVQRRGSQLRSVSDPPKDVRPPPTRRGTLRIRRQALEGGCDGVLRHGHPS
jgi:hypothetical protein